MAVKPEVKQASVSELIDKELSEGRGMENILERFKNCVLVRALEMTGGNKVQASVLLKCHRNNIQRWIDEFGLHDHYVGGKHAKP